MRSKNKTARMIGLFTQVYKNMAKEARSVHKKQGVKNPVQQASDWLSRRLGAR